MGLNLSNVNRANVLVMPVRWEQFARSFESNRVPCAFLGLVSAAPAAEPTGPPVESIRERLVAAAAGQPRRTVLQAHLEETAARVLKTGSARIDPTEPLGSMGLNSLAVLELVRHLSATTGVRLPATAVFNHPTIVLLSQEIARRMGIRLDEEALPGVPDVVSRTVSSMPAAADLSDEEAIAALVGQNRDPE